MNLLGNALSQLAREVLLANHRCSSVPYVYRWWGTLIGHSVLQLQDHLLFHSIHPCVALGVENSYPVYSSKLIPAPLSSASDSLGTSSPFSA